LTLEPQVGRRHDGLSGEEKKNTGNNFELHLELAESRNIAAVFIPQNVGVYYKPHQENGALVSGFLGF
jgi:hypothetical protein